LIPPSVKEKGSGDQPRDGNAVMAPGTDPEKYEQSDGKEN